MVEINENCKATFIIRIKFLERIAAFLKAHKDVLLRIPKRHDGAIEILHPRRIGHIEGLWSQHLKPT